MDISSPQVNQQTRPSIVWLIPLITLLVAAWLIIKTLSEQGPQATISFKTGESIEVGKTKIKYKNVDIGVVEQLQFSDDFSNVILEVQFNQGSEQFLHRNTRFWVVKPQLSLRGASGLSTLVSGAYIEIEPGSGAEQRHFVGLEKQPVVKADEQGKKILLVTQKLGSIDIGSPVYYQGLLAGEILGHELGNDRKSIYVHAFVKDPFDQLIRGNTNFWNVSGINVSMGADGFKVQTESLQSMMFGGIAFETPETLEQATTEIDDLVFTLHDSHESIQENTYSRKVRFIMFFASSVRGLSKGAPVEFKGIKVGSVLDIRLEFDSKKASFRVPVLIEIEPQRIIERDNLEAESTYKTLNKLVEQGLRARLKTGSLLTSQLFVELDMYPGTPINLSGEDTQYPEMPSLETANFAAITQLTEDLLTKLNAIDAETVTTEFVKSIHNANKTLETVDKAFTSANTLITPETIKDLQTALDKANKILDPNSPVQYNLIKMTGELEEAARSIRSLIDTLERNPQALIFGKDKKAKGE